MERALKAIDLQSPADHFPRPGEVLVDASELSIEEKALILYRHARVAVTNPQTKGLVRAVAPTIVSDRNFTPERIRRFVRDVLPTLPSEVKTGKTSSKEHASVRQIVAEAIRNPTTRMRRSFERLLSSDKWLLIALLEAGHFPTIEKVRERYDAHCPAELNRPIHDLLEELCESFVKLIDGTEYTISAGQFIERPTKRVHWIHPSYRDLVIDELCSSPLFRNAFLSQMGVPGVILSLSDAGGRLGERRMPLMVDATSWHLLDATVQRLARSVNITDLLRITGALVGAAQVNHANRETALAMLRSVLLTASNRWCTEEVVLTCKQLQEFVDASLLCPPLVPVPALQRSWKESSKTLKRDLNSGLGYFHWRDSFESWVNLVQCILGCEPRFLSLAGFPESEDTQTLLRLVAKELSLAESSREIPDTRDECHHDITVLTKDIEILDQLLTTARKGRIPEDLIAIRPKLSAWLLELEQQSEKLGEDEPEEEALRPAIQPTFDISALFKDL